VIRTVPAVLLLFAAALGACGGPAPLARGPVIGHLDAGLAVIGWQAPTPGAYTLALVPAEGAGSRVEIAAVAREEDDRALRWRAQPLEADTAYLYAVKNAAGIALARGHLRTAPAAGSPARVRLAVGSCAASEDHAIWGRMVAQKVHAIVLLGDAPYIDSTELATARAAHQAFLAMPSLSAALRSIPLWSTWDDHDYGRDNGDGALVGKEQTRRAWFEARPQATYGQGEAGIYTCVRHGPVEVFLLDLRWFAGLEADANDPQARSLLGRTQRAWLEEALRASDAPFKLLCGGMVWHDKGGRSQDDWATYAAERDALFAFLGREHIDGCVLLGGDVHACQHAVYEQTGAGYPLHELIVSPLHERTWRGGDRAHPARQWGAVVPHVFLQVDVDTTGDEPTLQATWKDASGRTLHDLTLHAAQLAGHAADSSRR
jgi:alkaline phosphatase D